MIIFDSDHFKRRKGPVEPAVQVRGVHHAEVLVHGRLAHDVAALRALPRHHYVGSLPPLSLQRGNRLFLLKPVRQTLRDVDVIQGQLLVVQLEGFLSLESFCNLQLGLNFCFFLANILR